MEEEKRVCIICKEGLAGECNAAGCYDFCRNKQCVRYGLLVSDTVYRYENEILKELREKGGGDKYE